MPTENELAPTYSDDVVLLNAFKEEDVDDHLAGEDEETARQFGWWPRRSTRETVQHTFHEWADNWRNYGLVHTFAVRDKTTGTLLGGCQLRKRNGDTGDVSCWTAAPHRGRGIATRALRLLCVHARAEAIHGLEAHISADNPASQAVATRAGFTLRPREQDAEGELMLTFRYEPAPAPTKT